MPYTNITSWRCLAVFLLLCVPATIARVDAGPAEASAQTAEAQTAVAVGIDKERARNWLEAIEHYEHSLKQWPQDKQLQYGLRRSKIHFGIERRYADGSFESALLRKSRSEALDLFDEVLDQIRGHYVDSLSPTSYVSHGTESFYLALANDRFIERQLPNVDKDKIAHFRKVLREQYWNKPIPQGSRARTAVSQICDLAQAELGVSDSAVVMEYVFGGCNALDDYSGYLTPDRLSDLYGNIEGEFVGLGIEMKADEGKGMLLVNVLPESPAAEGGLRRGEHIVVIDGRDCRSMTTDDAARFLRGPSGTTVQLEVNGPNDEGSRSGAFQRRAVHVKSIPVARMIDRDHGIAYIQMTGFQKSSPEEMDESLGRLQRQGMRALIWDLRSNPGGLLTAAWEVADRFIDEGTIVSTKGRTQDQNLSYPARPAGTWKLPIVLLVDNDSASASEIVAGAVRDHHRGMIVGRRTYGKWSVQSIFPLRNATGLRLTTAKFYSPAGRNLGKIGVEPDVVVDVPKEHVTYFRAPSEQSEIDGDTDIQKGVEILTSQLTRR